MTVRRTVAEWGGARGVAHCAVVANVEGRRPARKPGRLSLTVAAAAAVDPSRENAGDRTGNV